MVAEKREELVVIVVLVEVVDNVQMELLTRGIMRVLVDAV